jgi:hypothetical protein
MSFERPTPAYRKQTRANAYRSFLLGIGSL